MEHDQLPADTLPNPLENLVGFQLRQVSMAISTDLSERLAPLSLTLISLSVLLIIESAPGVTQSEMCRRLGVKRANMTPLAFQFEARSLIERLPTDGRSQGLRLTTKGQDVATKARQIVAAHEALFLSILSEEEQTALRAALISLQSARTRTATTITS